MLKKQQKTSPIDGLSKHSFICFGLGAVLYSISEAFWINFAAYFLINELEELGNIIFLISQIFQGLGILLAWFLLTRLHSSFGNHMTIYLAGTILMMITQPIIFLPGINNFWITLTASILAKIGSSFCLFSQITMVSLVTNSRSRRKKLVAKVTQFGLGSTFLIMLFMMVISQYVPFTYKFIAGVMIYVALGGLASVLFMYRIHENQLCVYTQGVEITNSVSWTRQPRFYIYGFVTIFGSLYTGIITALYPYFVKYFEYITQFKYLTAIMLLYLFAFLGGILVGKIFMFTGSRPLISIGMGCSIVSMILYVFSFNDAEYGALIYIGTSITGVSKSIISNCTVNIINEMVGVRAKSREFIYGIYLFAEKITTGIVIFFLINAAMEGSDQTLNLCWIYIPFFLYFLSWMAIVLEQSAMKDKSFSIEDKRVKLKIENIDDLVIH